MKSPLQDLRYALLACVPARRANQVNPATALRHP